MDTLSKADRSRRMSLIKGKDSKPEMKVRRLVHRLGYRYRLHDKSLPGKPDLVFKSRRKIIFVHGCFWHRHADCKLARTPKTRINFWQHKLDSNADRDDRNRLELERRGWESLVVWECQLRDEKACSEVIEQFLGERRTPSRGQGRVGLLMARADV